MIIGTDLIGNFIELNGIKSYVLRTPILLDGSTPTLAVENSKAITINSEGDEQVFKSVSNKWVITNELFPIYMSDTATKDLRLYENFSIYNNDITQAITQLNGKTTTLIMPRDVSVSTSVIIPNTLNFQPVNGAKFIKSGSGSIIFNNFGITGDPKFQIFSGFSPGDITWNGNNVPSLRPEWWGAKGDLINDDYNALNCALSSYNQTQGGIFTGARKGITVLLSDGCSYYSSNTIEIKKCCYFGGSGGFLAYNTPRIVVPSNKIGIIVHGSGTKTGTLSDETNGIGSHLRSFNIEAVIGPTINNTILNGSALELTLVGGDIQSVSLYGSNDGSVTSLPPGTTITLNNFPYVVDNSISTIAGTTIPIQLPRFSCYSDGSNLLYKSHSARLPNTNDWVGQTIKIYKQFSGQYITRTIISQTTSSITVDSPISDGFAFYATVAGINNISNQNARINIYHGIDYRSESKVEGVSVAGFNGNGHNLQSVRYPSTFLPSSPNLNSTYFNIVYANFVEGSGLVIAGGNSNQMSLNNLDVQECRGWGIYESDSSGNNYSFHSSNNTAGSFKCVSNISNSILTGCYSESSQPPPRFSAANVVIGGTWGSGFGEGYQPLFTHSYGYLKTTQPLSFHRPLGTYLGVENTEGIRSNLGSNDVPYCLFETGVGSEQFNTNLGGTIENCDYAAIKFGYNVFTGRYDLRYGTSDEIFLSISGSNASEGKGVISFPNGIKLNNETLFTNGVVSPLITHTALALSGPGIITLGPPSSKILGQIKTIEMVADNGDVSLSLINVIGQSSGTTVTFNNVTDSLVLLAMSGYWLVIKENGVVTS